jgi:hypothetical protein
MYVYIYMYRYVYIYAYMFVCIYRYADVLRQQGHGGGVRRGGGARGNPLPLTPHLYSLTPTPEP